MDYHLSFPFTRLPEDIQVRVLLNLEAPDILRFQQVSKALSKLGDDLAVQYKLQLDIAGMVDNPHHPSPMIERFRKLLEYQEGWHKHALAVDPNVPVPVPRDPLFGLLWEFEGGVFPYIVNSQSSQQQTLHLYRPGSPLRGIKPQKWTVEPAVPPGGYRYMGCGIDVAQDLLILSLMPPSPYDPESDRACIFQLQSLRRPGVAHPQAARHILHGLSLRADQAMSAVQICENIVACAVYQDEWELNLWDWKTGTLRMRLRFSESSFHGFTLLTPSYLVLLTGSQADPDMSLSVYWIPSHDSAPDSLSRIRQNDDGPDVVLKLMPFSDEHVSSILAYLSHSRETASPDDDSPLFEHNPDLAILTLLFSVYASRPDRHVDQFLLVASVSGIVRTLDRARVCASMDASESSQPEPLLTGDTDRDRDTVEPRPRVLEWDEWGPPSTRLIGLARELWNDAPTPSRTRCALAFQGTAPPGDGGGRGSDSDDTYLFVINAHPHSTLAPGYRDVADEDTASFLVCEDVFTAAPHVFRAPVRSTLPVGVSCRRLPRHPAPYLGIGLFEDGLSVMYLYEPDDPRSGEMFMFCV